MTLRQNLKNLSVYSLWQNLFLLLWVYHFGAQILQNLSFGVILRMPHNAVSCLCVNFYKAKVNNKTRCKADAAYADTGKVMPISPLP